MSVLSSRENPKVKRWTKLARDSRYRRVEKRALIEGPHLLAAALEKGHKPIALIATEDGAADPEIARLIRGFRPVLLSRGVFKAIADAENPPGVAAEIAIPDADRRDVPRAVFLEGVQDPGNVGAIIRSAAAFGVGRVVLDRDCADPWSPRTLRAGMGGHFALDLAQVEDLGKEIDAFRGTVACTVPRGGVVLREAPPERNLAWIFGGEGRGLSDAIIKRADLRVTIPMSAGTESLNVAAAAAICLYQGFSRSAAGS